jgi:lipid A 3-O-deacylase
MKKILFIIFSLVLFYHTAIAAETAEPSGYEVSFGYGQDDSDINIFRLGLKKDFTSRWLESNSGYCSGYFELSYNHWEKDGENVNGVALSPVFVYYPGAESNKIKPYIEGGIGVAYIDEYHIAGRNLSTNFQFEDRIGIGVKMGLFDLNFRYMHYSNASVKQPNDGIDIWMFTTSIKF